MLKRLSLAALGLLALCSAALAQANPTFGVTSGYAPKQTYSAVWIGLVPAASATDIVCIAGSASKTITLNSIKMTGTAAAGNLTIPATVLRRVSLDTGGTAGTTTANPANTISRRVTTNGAPTATLISYTANPTIVDTSPTYIDSMVISPAVATTNTTYVAFFDWGKDIENLQQAPTMRNGQTTQQICLNLNGTTITSGVLTGSITWTEE